MFSDYDITILDLSDKAIQAIDLGVCKVSDVGMSTCRCVTWDGDEQFITYDKLNQYLESLHLPDIDEWSQGQYFITGI